jgi:hypothetical protein
MPANLEEYETTKQGFDSVQTEFDNHIIYYEF